MSMEIYALQRQHKYKHLTKGLSSSGCCRLNLSSQVCHLAADLRPGVNQ